jgi:hypothetical protein
MMRAGDDPEPQYALIILPAMVVDKWMGGCVVVGYGSNDIYMGFGNAR